MVRNLVAVGKVVLRRWKHYLDRGIILVMRIYPLTFRLRCITFLIAELYTLILLITMASFMALLKRSLERPRRNFLRFTGMNHLLLLRLDMIRGLVFMGSGVYVSIRRVVLIKARNGRIRSTRILLIFIVMIWTSCPKRFRKYRPTLHGKVKYLTQELLNTLKRWLSPFINIRKNGTHIVRLTKVDITLLIVNWKKKALRSKLKGMELVLLFLFCRCRVRRLIVIQTAPLKTCVR